MDRSSFWKILLVIGIVLSLIAFILGMNFEKNYK